MKLISVCIMVAMFSIGAEAAFMQQDRTFVARSALEMQTEYLSVPGQTGYRQLESLRQIVRRAYANDSIVNIRARHYQQYAASQIKKYLVAQGIATERVRIEVRATTNALHQDELDVSVETLAARRERCHYANQDYRYSVEPTPGCALKNNLQHALVNPARSIF